MNSNSIRTIFASLLLSLFAVCSLSAAPTADLGSVRQRMDSRLSSVDGLKARGVVGENNRGYLDARASLSPDESRILKEENEDRALVYGSIAQKTGQTTDQVARLRASKIASLSVAGVWVQRESGEWYKK
jgi:uncharacterized protein YdbL (DUF1318 family)